jgi:hypothetical protein
MTIITGMKARVRFMSGIAWIGLLMWYGTWMVEIFFYNHSCRLQRHLREKV